MNYTNKNPWLWGVYVVVIGLPLVLIISCCCSNSPVFPTSLLCFDFRFFFFFFFFFVNPIPSCFYSNNVERNQTNICLIDFYRVRLCRRKKRKRRRLKVRKPTTPSTMTRVLKISKTSTVLKMPAKPFLLWKAKISTRPIKMRFRPKKKKKKRKRRRRRKKKKCQRYFNIYQCLIIN